MVLKFRFQDFVFSFWAWDLRLLLNSSTYIIQILLPGLRLEDRSSHESVLVPNSSNTMVTAP